MNDTRQHPYDRLSDWFKLARVDECVLIQLRYGIGGERDSFIQENVRRAWHHAHLVLSVLEDREAGQQQRLIRLATQAENLSEELAKEVLGER